MPNFKPETCEEVEDDEDEAPVDPFDAGKIFIFVTCFLEMEKEKISLSLQRLTVLAKKGGNNW